VCRGNLEHLADSRDEGPGKTTLGVCRRWAPTRRPRVWAALLSLLLWIVLDEASESEEKSPGGGFIFRGGGFALCRAPVHGHGALALHSQWEL